MRRPFNLWISTLGLWIRLGDIADFLYRSNIQARNIFRQHFEDRLTKEQKEGTISPEEEAQLRAMAGQDV